MIFMSCVHLHYSFSVCLYIEYYMYLIPLQAGIEQF